MAQSLKRPSPPRSLPLSPQHRSPPLLPRSQSSSLTGPSPAQLPSSWAPCSVALCAPPSHPPFCSSHQPGPCPPQVLCTRPAWHAPPFFLWPLVPATGFQLTCGFLRGLYRLPASISPRCFFPYHPRRITASDRAGILTTSFLPCDLGQLPNVTVFGHLTCRQVILSPPCHAAVRARLRVCAGPRSSHLIMRPPHLSG